MHNFFINKQADKILAIAILLALLSAGYFFASHIYLEQLSRLKSEIEFKKKSNAKIDSILAHEKDLKDKIERQRYANKKNVIFLTSSKSTTAASELQNDLKKLIATHSNAKILTIKPYPVVEYEHYSETSLEIRIKDISHEGLHNVLYRIENNAPVLQMKELDIKLTQLRYKSLVEQNSELENLAVTMVVSGFFRTPSGEI